MFEFFASPDGHFGLAGELKGRQGPGSDKFRCPTCGASYRLLPRLSPSGQTIEREYRGTQSQDDWVVAAIRSHGKPRLA